MTQPILSVVIPTQGRSTLERALKSIRDQATPSMVEIVLVADAYDLPDEAALEIAGLAELYSARLASHDAGYHAWGHPQLNEGMRRARGLYLTALGDDDLYKEGAMSIVAAALTGRRPARVSMFRVELWPSKSRVVSPVPYVIPFDRSMGVGRITAQNAIMFNDESKLAHYPPHPTGDQAFIVRTVDAFGGADEVAWHEEIIAECR